MTPAVEHLMAQTIEQLDSDLPCELSLWAGNCQLCGQHEAILSMQTRKGAVFSCYACAEPDAVRRYADKCLPRPPVPSTWQLGEEPPLVHRVRSRAELIEILEAPEVAEETGQAAGLCEVCHWREADYLVYADRAGSLRVRDQDHDVDIVACAQCCGSDTILQHLEEWVRLAVGHIKSEIRQYNARIFMQRREAASQNVPLVAPKENAVVLLQKAEL